MLDRPRQEFQQTSRPTEQPTGRNGTASTFTYVRSWSAPADGCETGHLAIGNRTPPAKPVPRAWSEQESCCASRPLVRSMTAAMRPGGRGAPRIRCNSADARRCSWPLRRLRGLVGPRLAKKLRRPPVTAVKANEVQRPLPEFLRPNRFAHPGLRRPAGSARPGREPVMEQRPPPPSAWLRHRTGGQELWRVSWLAAAVTERRCLPPWKPCILCLASRCNAN